MMQAPPLFSVIVPTHKRAGLLRRALQSLKLQQASAALQVLVVSDVIDAGTDAVCAELLEPTDVYMRRGGKPGPSSSRNAALDLAKGRYVMFLDDDDAWHPDCLAQLLAQPAIQQGQAVYFNCSVVQESRRPEGAVSLSELALDLAGRLTDEVYVKNQVHMSCFAFPRTLLDGLRFDPFMRGYEDWEFLLAVFERQMPVHIPILGTRVYEVQDDTTDRRGSSSDANNFNAVLDYLYVYRRRPAPSDALKRARAELLGSCGLALPAEFL